MSRNGHHYPPDELPEEEEGDIFSEGEIIFTDEIDHRILMHRDAHFGGDFDVMMNYYNSEESIGVDPEIELERINYLAEVEKELGQDLASLILSGAEAEAVGRARQAYAQLKEIYEIVEEADSYPKLIADLILSERDEPEEEIAAIVAQNGAIVPELLAIVHSDEMYDPLYPGYGYAPYLAILCLGRIGDERAIIPLFETLGRETIFDEMVVIEALAEIGTPAKEFLLSIVQSRPLTHDNINAAFALTPFAYDPQVAAICFEQLKDPLVQEKPLLRGYLISDCESLYKTPSKEEFIALSQDKKIPEEMRSQMKALASDWKGH